MTSKTFHKGKYLLHFKRGFDELKKNINFTVEKVYENDSLKISLSDDEDPTFLCILNITHSDYEDLKKQQGLLIDFENFPSQFVKLLKQCALNNMFLIIKHINPMQVYLEIVEHNEFKRLVHLSLKTGLATDVEIKQHMADTIFELKNSLSAVQNSATNSELIWNEKFKNMERNVHDLNQCILKMEEEKQRLDKDYQDKVTKERDHLTQERLQWQKNADSNLRAQLASVQENMNKKDKQMEDLNVLYKKLQDSKLVLDNQISEKSQRLHVLENEVQKSHIEIATLSAKLNALERENNDKDHQNKQLNTQCLNLEKIVKNNTDMINDLSVSLQIIKKEKASLEERLTLSESFAKKNNEVVRTTSEQLLKANQIISKQNSELVELKEKLMCRTAIALEQEKVIESNAKEIDRLKTEVNVTKQELEKLEMELQIMKQKCETTEKQLGDRDEIIKNNNMVIEWLHKKVENSCVVDLQEKNKFGAPSATSSTPYFIPRHNQTESSHGLSEESINFYATSKSTNMEDSPVQIKEKLNPGLDPRYLKPADNDNQVKLKTNSASSAGPQNQGKENKNINLPKVDYREKKSQRSSYRATPVSAYFPR